MFRSMLAAILIFVGSTTFSSAATYTVDFSFSSVTGFFTFDDISDGSRGALDIEFTSNSIGEFGSGYAFTNNIFNFSGGLLFSAISTGFRATSVTHIFALFEDGANNVATLQCIDDGGTGCEADGIEGVWTFDAPTQVVPLPAGIALLLTGVTGFAGLRARKKRAARI